MAKLFVYEFVFGLSDGTQSRVHTIRSNNWRDAVKAIQKFNPRDELVAFQLADAKNPNTNGAKAAKDAIVEHPIMATVRSLSAEPD